MLLLRLMCVFYVCSHGGLPSHHRGGVRDEDHGGPRSEGEAADLGHGRSGALQGRHQVLLQRGRRGPHGVRHHQVRSLLLLQTQPTNKQMCSGSLGFKGKTSPKFTNTVGVKTLCLIVSFMRVCV